MISAIPFGALLFAGCIALAVVPLRRPRAFATSSWLVTMVPNELPFLFLLILAASWAPPLVADGLTSVRDWVGLAVALATAVGLTVVARRAFQARPALDRALEHSLGAGWRGEIPASRADGLRRRRPWWRVLGMPWPFRPADVERISDIRYGPNPESNVLDVYRHRSGPRGAPTLIHFHGGHFRGGRKSWEGRPLLHRLAQQGWTCISANYHLSRSPGAGFPHHLIDAKRVIAWARSEGARFGVDPETIFVAGSSAGAHMAAMIALTPDDPTFQPGFEHADTSITGAIGLYGYYGRLDGSGRPTSPLDYVGAATRPPCFLIHGTNDTYTPIEGARALTASLRRNSRTPVVLAELPGAQHSFDVFHSVRFEAVVDAIEEFAAWTRSTLNERSGPPRPVSSPVGDGGRPPGRVT
jgi:acetyl esterase/lipase